MPTDSKYKYVIAQQKRLLLESLKDLCGKWKQKKNEKGDIDIKIENQCNAERFQVQVCYHAG